MKFIELLPEDRESLARCILSLSLCALFFTVACLLVLSRHPDSDFEAPSAQTPKVIKFTLSAGCGSQGRTKRPIFGIETRV